MSDWKRVQPPELLLRANPGTRVWQREVEDGHLSVIRTVEPTLDVSAWRTHISISHRKSDGSREPGRYPTWDEQREAVWRFAPGKAMASYLPAEGDPYVNLHPTTFHWWEVPDTEVIR